MKHHSYIVRIVAGIVCVFTAFAAAVPLYAAVVRGGEEYILAPDTRLEDDFYFLGNTVTLAGTTTGDALVVGSQAILFGDIEGDAFVLAGRATFTGSVVGDLRVLGGEVVIKGTVEEDLIILAGNVTLAESGRVRGDVLAYGDRYVQKGDVDGAVEVHTRLAEVQGKIEENASFFVSESLSFLGTSTVNGVLTYTAPRKAFVSETAILPTETSFTPSTVTGGEIAFSSTAFMVQILMFVLAAVLLGKLYPGFSQEIVQRALGSQGGKNVLKGFVFMFATPVIAVFAMLTLVGFLPGALLLFAYLGGLVLAAFMVPGMVGAILARWLKKQEESARLSWASLGAIVFVFLSLIPIIGSLARLLLVVLAFGTLVVYFYEKLWVNRATISTVSTDDSNGKESTP